MPTTTSGTTRQRHDGELFADDPFDRYPLPVTPTVGDILRTPPVVLSPEMKLVDALGELHAERVRAALVVTNGFLVGVLDEMAAVHAVAQTPSRARSLRVSSVMSRVQHVLWPADSVDYALRRLEADRVARLPVMGADHMPLGLVEARDLARLIEKRTLARSF